jgi:hypothetical protein
MVSYATGLPVLTIRRVRSIARCRGTPNPSRFCPQLSTALPQESHFLRAE